MVLPAAIIDWLITFGLQKALINSSQADIFMGLRSTSFSLASWLYGELLPAFLDLAQAFAWGLPLPLFDSTIFLGVKTCTSAQADDRRDPLAEGRARLLLFRDVGTDLSRACVK